MVTMRKTVNVSPKGRNKGRNPVLINAELMY